MIVQHYKFIKMKKDRKIKLEYAFGHHRKVDVFYVTSDDQIFTLESDARNHAKSLDKKEVESYRRNEILGGPSDKEKEELQQAAEDDHREFLFERHEELFGKLPAKNAKNETIEKKIADHEHKLAEEEETEKHIVTEEDLKNNPDLVDQGVKVGDEIGIPKE